MAVTYNVNLTIRVTKVDSAETIADEEHVFNNQTFAKMVNLADE